jgi:hypothetical protein
MFGAVLLSVFMLQACRRHTNTKGVGVLKNLSTNSGRSRNEKRKYERGNQAYKFRSCTPEDA